MISLRAARSSVAPVGVRIAVVPMVPSLVEEAFVVASASRRFKYRSAAIVATGPRLLCWNW